jgi:diamine N-acetyltransferase
MEGSNRRIHFSRISAANVLEVCALSESLPPAQRRMVADNAISIAQAHYSENAWMRSINLEDTPIGFILLHFGSDYDDGIDCPGAFLWRMMIAEPYQVQGYGREALLYLVEHLKAQGWRALYTSTGLGEGSPQAFYLKFGFEPTGEHYGDQPELVLKLE